MFLNWKKVYLTIHDICSVFILLHRRAVHLSVSPIDFALNMPTVPLMRQFYQALTFVVVCQAPSTTPVNKTTADGKVSISGDHNKVILYTSHETKKALYEIKSELNSLNERNKKFAERILSLGKHTERKLDFMNKSNAGLSAQVQAMAQRLATLEKQGTHAVQFY